MSCTPEQLEKLQARANQLVSAMATLTQVIMDAHEKGWLEEHAVEEFSTHAEYVKRTTDSVMKKAEKLHEEIRQANHEHYGDCERKREEAKLTPRDNKASVAAWIGEVQKKVYQKT